MFKMINEKIVLVTDSNTKRTEASISNRNLEGNNSIATQKISNAIKNCCKEFQMYTKIEDFVDNIKQHKNDLIFPMKYGKNTPDSKSIIPGICEGMNMRYIGADDYTHMICNDKYTSKLFAKQFGIKSAPCFLVRNFDNKEYVIEAIKNLKLPLVIKPNFGGGSTGISNNNICFDYDEAIKLCEKLFYYHEMPILVEEYLDGQEIELILVGNKNQVVFSQEVQLIMANKESFDKEIWGFETKKIDDSSIGFKLSSYIDECTKEKIHCLFKSFYKMEFMRVDGRFHNGEFHLIELSPDCYLGDDCAFYYAFQKHGYSLSDMFEFLINNGLNHYQL